MTVTEGLMAQGSWSLRLKPETPYAVRSLLGVWGHVVMTPERLRPELINDATILSGGTPLARYSGVVMRIARLELSGSGLIRWFGDESGKGPHIGYSGVARTFAQRTAAIFSVAVQLSSGFISTTPTGTRTRKVATVTARTVLDQTCEDWGTEWRVKPHGYVDIAPASELFVTTPTVVVTRHDLAGELTYAEVQASELNAELNAEEYASAIYLATSGEGAGYAPQFDFVTAPYFALNGNRLVYTRWVDSPSTDSADGTAAAAALAAAKAKYVGDTGLRRPVKLSSEFYDIGRRIAVGDTIYVYDPDEGLVDTANQITHQGRVIFPIALRVLGYTWPIDARLGVFFRSGDGNGTWTDLTPYVEPENGTTTIEVGAAPAVLTGAAEGRVSMRSLEERQSR